MTAPAYEKSLDVVVERVVEPTGRTVWQRVSTLGACCVALGLVAVLSASVEVLCVVLLAVAGLAVHAGLGRGQRHEEMRFRTVAQPVRITEGAIETEHGAIALASIAQAYLQAHEGRRSTVLLVDRSGRPLFEAAVDSDREGDDFLRALGRDIQHRRETWRVSGPFFATGPRRIATFFAAFLGSIIVSRSFAGVGLGGTITAILSTLFFFGSFAVAVRSGRVDVGADGLLFRWLWTKRFVPWRRVTRVDHASGDAVRVVLTGGRPLHLEDPGARSARTAETRALVHASLRARIVDAWQAHRLRETRIPVPAQLSRTGRSVTEWRRSLATLRGGTGGYRGSASRDEDLWRVVEDGAAPEDARAAAALALRSAEGAGARLRVAAATVASPHLRIALETAGDPEAADARLDEALAHVGQRE